MSRWESQARQRERRLAELERELLEKTSRVESLRRQLDEATRQLEEAGLRQGEAEQKLALRLQQCEEELARQAATPPRVKVRRCTGVSTDLGDFSYRSERLKRVCFDWLCST